MTLKQNADGTTTVWDKNGYAGKIANPDKTPTSPQDAIKQAQQRLMDLTLVPMDEATTETEQQLEMAFRRLEMLKTAYPREAADLEVATDKRPITVDIAQYVGEDPDVIPEETYNPAPNRPQMRDFNIESADGDTQVLLSTLAIAAEARRPIMIWGPPGTGKTSIVQSYADSIGASLRNFDAPSALASEMIGIPEIKDGVMRTAAPEWAQEIIDHPERRFVVFLDELPGATDQVKGALLTVIQDRRIGSLKFGNNVSFVAAGNDMDTAENGTEFAPATSNRYVHVEYNPSPEETIDARRRGYYRAPQLKVSKAEEQEEVRKVDSMITGFMEANPGMINNPPVDADDPAYGKAFPTQRSWENLGTTLGKARAAHASQSVIDSIVTGSVGRSAATEFLAYIERNDLPSIKDVLADPKKWKPQDTERANATVGSVMDSLHTTAGKASVASPEYLTQWRQSGEVLIRLADLGMNDLAATHARNLLAADMMPSSANQLELMKTLRPLIQKLGPLVTGKKK